MQRLHGKCGDWQAAKLQAASITHHNISYIFTTIESRTHSQNGRLCRLWNRY